VQAEADPAPGGAVDRLQFLDDHLRQRRGARAVEPLEVDDRLAVSVDAHIVEHVRLRDLGQLGEHPPGVEVEFGEPRRLGFLDRGAHMRVLQVSPAAVAGPFSLVAGADCGPAGVEVDEILLDKQLLLAGQVFGHALRPLLCWNCCPPST